ncbi:hypothetical protein [Granulicella sp. S190]|uniref:hypothetical protein n=1 Tax=Granulicella sp. S190 TaxID=1747226 RepID=UPI00131BA542|nr:hypothetical protein [Granulicella sp. S190]
MSSLNLMPSDSGPRWSPKAMHLSGCIALVLLLAAWCCSIFGASTKWGVSLAGVSTLLAGTAYALYERPRPRRLVLFGKDKVQVRSLDEWTLYQYGVTFEEGSTEQQNEALSHYKVGLRLFPARPQDRQPKQGVWQWLLSFVVFCSFVTLSEAVRGWYRLLLVAVFYAWLWACLRLSRRLEVPATKGLTGLDLS